MSTFAEQVTNAVAAHGQWKARLRQAIADGNSEFQVSVVRQDNQCAFGNWLYGDGKSSFPSTDAYEDVRGLHAEFHRQAAHVLALAVAGKPKEASEAMDAGAPFNKVSAALVNRLTHLRPAA